MATGNPVYDTKKKKPGSTTPTICYPTVPWMKALNRKVCYNLTHCMLRIKFFEASYFSENRYDYCSILCLTTSYINTAAATETLSDSILPSIGILTCIPANFMYSDEIPSPSEPIIKANGPFRFS